jgi:hypothetical protein
MPELKGQLERLAEQGSARGAPAVWRAAQQELHAPLHPVASQKTKVRRRIGRVVTAVAVVVCLVALGVVVTVGRGHPSTARIAVAPHVTGPGLVLINGPGPVTVLDLATGSARTVNLIGKAGGDFTYDVVATGDHFVYQSAVGVFSIPASLQGRPTLLGRATGIYPSERPGRVWLVAISPDGHGNVSVQEVTVNGHPTTPRLQVPTPDAPTAPIRGGLIFGSDVWSAQTHLATAIPSNETVPPNVFDTHDNLAAWGGGCAANPFSGICSTLNVFNVTDHRERSYPTPPGTAGWITTAGEGSHGNFAPDGHQLALRAVTTPAAQTSQLYVLNLTTGTSTLVPESQARPYSPVAWTADGLSVLYENVTHTLGAYQPSTGALQAWPVPCCGLLVTTAAPTNPQQTDLLARCQTRNPTGQNAARAAPSMVNALNPYLTNPGLQPHDPVIGRSPLWVNRNDVVTRVPAFDIQTGDWTLRKFPWFRTTTDPLTIQGRRLDGPGTFHATHPADSSYPTGFIPSDLTFSTGGCWQITAHIDTATIHFYIGFSSSHQALCDSLTRQIAALTPNTDQGPAQAVRAAYQARGCP